MSRIVNIFIQIFKACKKNVILDLKQPGDIKLYLKQLLNNLSIDLKVDRTAYKNNILIVTHFLLNEHNNAILENIKKEILMKIVNEEKISIFVYATKIKFLMNEEFYVIRNNITNIMKEQSKDYKNGGDRINELAFYDGLKKKKQSLINFLKNIE